MRLHLVRHGSPRIDTSAPPREWSLSDEGAAGVRDLAASGVLPDDARWLSSDEPKAVQTARMLHAGPVEEVPALREQGRPAGWVDDYAVRAHRSMVREDEPAAPGWETAGRTRERVGAAVRELLRGNDDEVVLVGHATAWTLLVSELTGTPVDLVAWERLGMPDHCTIHDGALVSDWGSWQHGGRGTMESHAEPR